MRFDDFLKALQDVAPDDRSKQPANKQPADSKGKAPEKAPAEQSANKQKIEDAGACASA